MQAICISCCVLWCYRRTKEGFDSTHASLRIAHMDTGEVSCGFLSLLGPMGHDIAPLSTWNLSRGIE